MVKERVLNGVWEVLMIVAGILVALWIDDWNSDRVAEKDKRAFLQNLSVELKDNRDKIIYKQWDVRKAFKCLLTVIQHSGPIPKEIPDTTFLRFVHNSLGDLQVDFSDAAVLDMINSGQLQLIEHDSCRLLISEWEADLRHNVLSQGDSRQRLLDYLIQHVSFVSMDRYDAYLRKSGMSANSDFELDNRKILTDPIYQNLCEDHLWHVRKVMLHYEKLVKNIDDLQYAIQLELGEKPMRHQNPAL